MNLVVDIGNTNVTAGIVLHRRVLHQWRFSTQAQRTPDEYYLFLRFLLDAVEVDISGIDHTCISCVAPQALNSISSALELLTGKPPFIIRPGIKLNLRVRYNRPQDVGADRIVNAVAAKNIVGFPCIIVDLGTATTFCVVDPEGDYIGGAIFPGIKTTANALFASTALLPETSLQKPDFVIGRSTSESIQSGLFFGYLDMLQGMIMRFQRALELQAKLVITGGFSQQLLSYIETPATIEPHLTLLGLDYLVHLNKASSREGIIW